MALPIALAACSDDPVTQPVDDFLPTFSRTWQSTADENHTFALVSTDDGQATGTVTGTEEHPNFGTSDVSGSFQNSTITGFTIQRPGGDLEYTGRFLHSSVILLARQQDTLILFRQP